MDFKFIELKEVNDTWAKKMCDWENDTQIRHLFNVIKNKDHYLKLENWQKLKAQLNDFKGKRYGITLNGEPVGEFNFEYNHAAILKKNKKSAWIGLVIGEKKARGLGLGLKAMNYLEQQIKSNGGNRIELGVFNYNHAAISLYEKLQYKKIASIPDFTWWDGKMHDDFRYEKILQPYANTK